MTEYFCRSAAWIAVLLSAGLVVPIVVDSIAARRQASEHMQTVELSAAVEREWEALIQLHDIDAILSENASELPADVAAYVHQVQNLRTAQHSVQLVFAELQSDIAANNSKGDRSRKFLQDHQSELDATIGRELRTQLADLLAERCADVNALGAASDIAHAARKAYEQQAFSECQKRTGEYYPHYNCSSLRVQQMLAGELEEMLQLSESAKMAIDSESARQARDAVQRQVQRTLEAANIALKSGQFEQVGVLHAEAQTLITGQPLEHVPSDADQVIAKLVELNERAESRLRAREQQRVRNRVIASLESARGAIARRDHARCKELHEEVVAFVQVQPAGYVPPLDDLMVRFSELLQCADLLAAMESAPSPAAADREVWLHQMLSRYGGADNLLTRETMRALRIEYDTLRENRIRKEHQRKKQEACTAARQIIVNIDRSLEQALDAATSTIRTYPDYRDQVITAFRERLLREAEHIEFAMTNEFPPQQAKNHADQRLIGEFVRNDDQTIHYYDSVAAKTAGRFVLLRTSDLSKSPQPSELHRAAQRCEAIRDRLIHEPDAFASWRKLLEAAHDCHRLVTTPDESQASDAAVQRCTSNLQRLQTIVNNLERITHVLEGGQR